MIKVHCPLCRYVASAVMATKAVAHQIQHYDYAHSPDNTRRPTAVNPGVASLGRAALLILALLALAPRAGAEPWKLDGGDIEACVGDERAPSKCFTLTGPPAPEAAPKPQPIEGFADRLAADGMWMGTTAGLDLFTTSLALRNCPTCYEGNPLGWDAEARIALKASVFPIAMGACYWLRRTHHDDWANGLRWGVVVVNAFVIANNTVHAVKGR